VAVINPGRSRETQRPRCIRRSNTAVISGAKSPAASSSNMSRSVSPGSAADLRGANLRGANLTEAKLIEAILTGADLTRADLTGADLKNAILTGVMGADFTGALNVPESYIEYFYSWNV
jgi:uncharacterized protein YjbI with pentapeptide repeats